MGLTRQSEFSVIATSHSGWLNSHLPGLASLARMGLVRWHMQSAGEYHRITEFQRWATLWRGSDPKLHSTGADSEGQRSNALTQVHELAWESGDKNPGLLTVPSECILKLPFCREEKTWKQRRWRCENVEQGIIQTESIQANLAHSRTQYIFVEWCSGYAKDLFVSDLNFIKQK